MDEAREKSQPVAIGPRTVLTAGHVGAGTFFLGGNSYSVFSSATDPSADLTVHIMGTARSEWLLMRNRARRASDGYASLEIELWDPVEGLVAYGTQTMIFTFADAIPEGDHRYPLDVRRQLRVESR